MQTAPLGIRVIDDSHDLAACRDQWNSLVGNHPFANWEWMNCWWELMHDNCQLNVIVILNSRGDWVALLPAFIETTTTRNRVLRLISSGKTCADYLGFFAKDQYVEQSVSLVAEWITTATEKRGRSRINMIDFEGVVVGESDCVTGMLIDQLVENGMTRHESETKGCWFAELTDSWEVFETGLSKSFRRKTRKAEKNCDLPEVTVNVHDSRESIASHWDHFVDLHQMRRESLHEPGCFADQEFNKFLKLATQRLADDGRVFMTYATFHEKPMAAALIFTGSNCGFMYQSGFDPQFRHLEPGHLLVRAAIKECFDRKLKKFDFLRGDEPYKARWNTQRVPIQRIRIIPDRLIARAKHQIWVRARAVKHWTQQLGT